MRHKSIIAPASGHAGDSAALAYAATLAFAPKAYVDPFPFVPDPWPQRLNPALSWVSAQAAPTSAVAHDVYWPVEHGVFALGHNPDNPAANAGLAQAEPERASRMPGSGGGPDGQTEERRFCGMARVLIEGCEPPRLTIH